MSSNLTKTDVDNQIKAYVDTKTFSKTVEQIVTAKLKNYPELDEKILEISKNVLTQLYKTLWVKKDFWRNNLSNRSS